MFLASEAKITTVFSAMAFSSSEDIIFPIPSSRADIEDVQKFSKLVIYSYFEDMGTRHS